MMCAWNLYYSQLVSLTVRLTLNASPLLKAGHPVVPCYIYIYIRLFVWAVVGLVTLPFCFFLLVCYAHVMCSNLYGRFCSFVRDTIVIGLLAGIIIHIHMHYQS